MQTKWDVIVMGGGTAGVVAGVASARLGARTLIVERSGALGGNASTGMNLGGYFDGKDRQVVAGIPEEIVRRIVAAGGGRGHVFLHDPDRWISSTASVDPEIYKQVAFEMIEESGCGLWLYTPFIRAFGEAGRVTAVEVGTKMGVVRLEAEVFIDATGDADIAASVGAPFERGGGKRQQAVTCMFRVGNVDLPRFERFMEETVNTEGKTPWTFENCALRGSHKYWTPWKNDPEAMSRFAKQFGVYFHGTPGDVFLNCTHTWLDSLEPEDVTAGTMRLRKQVGEYMTWLKAKAPGFENAYLTQVYDLGIRESRRIIGPYMLTVDDMRNERVFDDVVAMGAYPPDLHDAKGGEILIHGEGFGDAESDADFQRGQNLPYNPGYQIPYRSLRPNGVDNLLVAGRCISASFEAQAGTRGMGPCSAMGQAVGTAAALALDARTSVADLDVRKLQATLLDNGAFLGEALSRAKEGRAA